jgi:2-alkyl-3-oxoalkanoate reductase
MVLVSGASGALGRRTVPALRERGWRIRCIVHRQPVPGADEIVHCDLARPRGLAAAFAGVDAVLHLAAVTYARRARTYERVNVGGTQALAELAAREGVARFVHVSSRAVGEQGGAYSHSKRRAEEIAAGLETDFVIVRLPEVYGAGSREGVDRVIDLVRRGRRVPIAGRGDEEVCPLFVGDAVGALVAAIDSPAASRNTYTLAGECLEMAELVERCAAAFGVPLRILRVPIPAVAFGCALARILPLPLFPDQLSRLRSTKPPPSRDRYSELGFAPRRLEAGLEQLEPAPGATTHPSPA